MSWARCKNHTLQKPGETISGHEVVPLKLPLDAERITVVISRRFSQGQWIRTHRLLNASVYAACDAALFGESAGPL